MKRSKALSKKTSQNANQPDQNIVNYSKFGIEGTSYLAFRDIPELLHKYVQGTKTLDYGCGAGRSTRFLKSIGLNVIGVDISHQFLETCKNDHEIHYCKIEKGKLPFIDESYDFIFSSLVFLTMPSKEEIRATLNELHRILKTTGTLIIVTGTPALHSPDSEWLSYETQFPENKNPISGSARKLFIKKANVTFHDYFWSDQDYKDLFQKTGFDLLKTHLPLGRNNEGYQWNSESKTAPFVVYILKKHTKTFQ